MSESIVVPSFIFPPSVVTKIDVSRLVSEMERIDSELITRDAHIRSQVAVTNQIALSQQLSDFLIVNKIEIGESYGLLSPKLKKI